MTELLERLDERAADAVSGWDGLAVFGWTCVILGGTAIQAAIVGGVALYMWKDVL